MRQKLDLQLAKLNQELLEMSALLTQMDASFQEVIAEKASESIEEILEIEADARKKEQALERRCLKLLLKEQPVASDLRRISAALKIVSNLKRIAQHYANASELLVAQIQDIQYDNIKSMSTVVVRMISQSVQAFVQRDDVTLDAVIREDDMIDALYANEKSAIIQHIKDNTKSGEAIIDQLMIAKYFERMGDRAVNIAEWVHFSFTGVLRDKPMFQ